MITEKDFDRLADFHVRPDERDALSHDCFELAKKMAVDFRKWYILQEREGNKEIYGKIPEQLLELYLNQNA